MTDRLNTAPDLAGYADGSQPLGAYAVLTSVFNAGLAAALISAHRRGRLPEQIGTRDIIVLGVATHKIARLLTKDSVTSFMRAPFVRLEDKSGTNSVTEHPRGSGLASLDRRVALLPGMHRQLGGLRPGDRTDSQPSRHPRDRVAVRVADDRRHVAVRVRGPQEPRMRRFAPEVERLDADEGDRASVTDWLRPRSGALTATKTTAVRELAERQFRHPLVSAFLDLDPTRFTTAGARATEINSLLDQAQQQLHAKPLEHVDRMALEQDIKRVGSYLSAELDASGRTA